MKKKEIPEDMRLNSTDGSGQTEPNFFKFFVHALQIHKFLAQTNKKNISKETIQMHGNINGFPSECSLNGERNIENTQESEKEERENEKKNC